MRRLFDTRPRGFLKWLLALPRVLYHMGLGFLLGHRFIMLTHRGRRSGRLYQTVLEVARYDAATRESIVMAGWGEQTDWYRNLQANGAVRAETGGERFVPTVRFLSPDEVKREMTDYFDRNRWARGIAQRWFGVRLWDSEEAPAHERLCGVAVRPGK
jgi:deazaflavin-dependent oxidoreductase (nitroreductase family)